MTRLDIRLLGEFAVLTDGVPLTTINSQRLQCLLAYLLLHREAPVARQRLAFLFWPDSTEAQARSNLRNLLRALSQALPVNGEHFVEADGPMVQWLQGAPYTLDVDSLLKALDQAQTAQDLQQALDLYRGPLLPLCYEDWIVPERERLEQKVADVLQRFIDRLEKEGSYRDAITFAQHLVRRDPLREDLYRQIMRLYALSGDRAGIARTYKECRTVLQNELDVEASRQTVEAYERCLRMETPGIRAPLTTPDPRSVPAEPDPPQLAVPATSNGAKAAAKTPKTPENALAPDKIRRAILSDALQAPSTAIPLAIAAMAFIYWLLFAPRTGWGGPFALALLALAAIVALASFIWLFAIRYDRSYEERSRAALAQQQRVEREQQQAGVEVLRSKLRDGFAAIACTEGQYALKALDYEYNELKGVLERHKERDPLAVAHLPALTNATYLQGLSVLDDALELARSVSSPTNQRLETDLKDLNVKIAAAKAKTGADEQVKLWRAKASSDRQRLDLVDQQRLRLQQLLQQADRCEGALQQTRIELASLKADASSGSVDSVLETLQKTIDQAKAIQEEMRKLGY
jgi:DNA-binding SARP family transcriptional activator